MNQDKDDIDSVIGCLAIMFVVNLIALGIIISLLLGIYNGIGVK